MLPGAAIPPSGSQAEPVLTQATRTRHLRARSNEDHEATMHGRAGDKAPAASLRAEANGSGERFDMPESLHENVPGGEWRVWSARTDLKRRRLDEVPSLAPTILPTSLTTSTSSLVPTSAPTSTWMPMATLSVPMVPTSVPTMPVPMPSANVVTEPTATKEKDKTTTDDSSLPFLYGLIALFSMICFLGKFSKRQGPEPAEYFETPHASKRMKDMKKPPKASENKSKRLGGWTVSGRKVGVQVDPEELSEIADSPHHTGWTPTGGRNPRLDQLEKDATPRNSSHQRSISPVNAKEASDSVDRRKAKLADEYAERERERKRKSKAKKTAGAGGDAKDKGTGREGEGKSSDGGQSESSSSTVAEDYATVMASLMGGSTSKGRSLSASMDDGSGGDRSHVRKSNRSLDRRRGASAAVTSSSNLSRNDSSKHARRATMGVATREEMDKLLDPLYLIRGSVEYKFASTDYAENVDRRMSGMNSKNIDVQAIQRALSGADPDASGDGDPEDDDEPIVRPTGRYKDDESKNRFDPTELNNNLGVDDGDEGRDSDGAPANPDAEVEAISDSSSGKGDEKDPQKS